MPDSSHSDSICLVGQAVGDFDLLRRLGSGGMADVYLAEQKSIVAGEVVLRRNVALKVLRRDLSKDKSYVKRFHREAQAAAGLVQSNIVQIYEVGETNGIHYIAQEYVRGRNLKQYLNRFGAVEPAMAVNVLRQAGLALQKASEMGVIHRDIKPENIMLSTSGEVKVADFGLARINDQRGRQDLTQIGITMGTPLYMSPEQVEGSSVDPRSDIYSLGITLYHMLSGEPPFAGDNALAIAVQHVKEMAKPLQQSRPDVPNELCELIHRMIAKEPENRFQSATDLLKSVRKIQISENVDWDEIAMRLAGDESESPTTVGHLAATRQLQAVMRGHVKSWWRKPLVIGSMALLTLCGIGLGWALAKQQVPANPLVVEIQADQASGIEKKESVEEQYRAARWLLMAANARTSDSNAMSAAAKSYRAVIDFHEVPQDTESEEYYTTKYYHLLSRQQLGEIYWLQNEWFAANEQFKVLKNEPDTFQIFRLHGQIGYAMYLDEVERDELGALQILKQLESEMQDQEYYLLNKFFAEALTSLYNKYPYQDGLGF